MSSYIVRLIRETDDGNIVNNNGQVGTLRQYPFTIDTCSLSALDNENGCYEVSLTSSDLYKLFVNGIEEKSFGGNNGYWIATENNNGWYFDRINSIRLSTSSNNVVIGTDLADSHKLAILGDTSITGNLFVTGSINSSALSSLTAGITLNQYTLTSNFVSTTGNLLTQLNSLSSNVGNLNRFTLTSTFASATASLTGATLFSKTSSQIFNTNSSDNLRLGSDVSNTGMKLDVQGVINLGNTTYFGTSGEKGRITWGGVPQSTSFFALGTNDVALGTNAGGELIRGTSAGNVGINTITPNARFTVNGNISSTGTTTHIGNTSISGNTTITGNLISSTANNIGLFVLSTGRVGINQSTPAQAFEVSGSLIGGQSFSLGKAPNNSLGYAFNRDFMTGAIYDSTRYAFQFTRPSNADRLDTEVYNGSGTLITARAFTIDSQGFVGIGTNSPATRLQVVGHQSISGGLIRTQLPDNSVTSNLTTGQSVTYNKGANHIIAYNDAGTIKYRYLVLTGTDANWTYTTTAP